MAEADEHGGEHQRPGAGEHGAAGAGGTSGPATKKARDKKTTIIVILTAVGVLIGWLTYRAKSSSSSTTAGTAGSVDTTGTPTTGANGSASYGGTGGYLVGAGSSGGGSYGTYGTGPTDGSTNSSALQGLSDRLDTLTSELSTLTATLQTAPTSPTTPTSPHTPTKTAPNIGRTVTSTSTAPKITTASQTNQYVLARDKQTGAWYDLTTKGTAHLLTPAQLAADRKAGARTTVIATRPTPSTARTTAKQVLGQP